MIQLSITTLNLIVYYRYRKITVNMHNFSFLKKPLICSLHLTSILTSVDEFIIYRDENIVLKFVICHHVCLIFTRLFTLILPHT